MPTCTMQFSPLGPLLTTWAIGGPRGITPRSPKGAKTQSLCVPAHACVSSCLAGFHPQLFNMPTKAWNPTAQAGACLQQALAPTLELSGVTSLTPSTTHSLHKSVRTD